MNTLNTKKGLNIGSGNWSFPNWIALHEKLGQALHSNSRFPFKSSKFDSVYSNFGYNDLFVNFGIFDKLNGIMTKLY